MVIEVLVNAADDDIMDHYIVKEEKRVELAHTLDFFDSSKI